MKLKKPKSCAYCRCYQDVGDHRGQCGLGFETMECSPVTWLKYGDCEDKEIHIKPKNGCYKPITIKEAVEARKLREDFRFDRTPIICKEEYVFINGLKYYEEL